MCFGSQQLLGYYIIFLVLGLDKLSIFLVIFGDRSSLVDDLFLGVAGRDQRVVVSMLLGVLNLWLLAGFGFCRWNIL